MYVNRYLLLIEKQPVILLYTWRLSERRIDLDVERLYWQVLQQRYGVVSGEFVGTMYRLEIPVRPVDVVLKHGETVRVSHTNVQTHSVLAV